MKSKLIVAAALGFIPGLAWSIDRIQGADSGLNCDAIATQQTEMNRYIEAGNTERGLGTAAAGGAANVGGQVATAQVAGGLFGAFGGIAAKVAGTLAQDQAEAAIGPDPAAVEKAKLAANRNDFLTQLALAKNCATPGGEKILSLEEFQKVATAAPIGSVKAQAMTPELVLSTLKEPVSILSTSGVADGNLKIKGKKVFLTEYRVLFDVSGEVKANTRGGYLLGSDYGSTRVTVKYKIPNVDVAAFQAITDKAFEDFKSRMATTGLDLTYGNPPEGGVYDATQQGSTPEAPVYITKDVGHSKRVFLVMAPTGMKLISRGFTGIGAGNIGNRIAWGGKNYEGMNVTQTINIADHESSGSGSSIFRKRSEADAKSGMSVAAGTGEFLVQTHVSGNLLRADNPVLIAGQFANFKDVGGFDSDKNTALRVVGTLQNLAGMGADKFKTVEKEVELDGAATARMALQGLATMNQAVAESIR